MLNKVFGLPANSPDGLYSGLVVLPDMVALQRLGDSVDIELTDQLIKLLLVYSADPELVEDRNLLNRLRLVGKHLLVTEFFEQVLDDLLSPWFCHFAVQQVLHEPPVLELILFRARREVAEPIELNLADLVQSERTHVRLQLHNLLELFSGSLRLPQQGLDLLFEKMDTVVLLIGSQQIVVDSK